MFNGSINTSASDVQAADQRLELLIGSQNKRKFLFDPDFLQNFVNNSYDSRYDEVRDYFNYLVPKITQVYQFQPVFRFEKFNNIADAQFPAPVALEATEDISPPTPTPTPTTENPSDQTPNDIQKALREDTILYQRLTSFENGYAAFSVKLPAQVTNFSVRVFLYNDDGKYGYAEQSIKVRKPINIVIDEPIYIYSDESFVVGVVVENNQSTVAKINFTSPVNSSLAILAQRSVTRRITFKASDLPLKIVVTDSTGSVLASQALSPSVVTAGVRSLGGTSGYVSSKGGSNSGLVYNDKLPSQLIKGRNVLSVCYQNNVISMILDVVKIYNRIPSGCFEQASMTTFPLIIAIQILRQLPQTDEVKKLLTELIENLRKGIDLLLTYECPSGGFEWFGADPGHVTLTSYGIWQFYLISKLNLAQLSFDISVLDRAKIFVQSQKDNIGGFKIRAGLDELGNPEQKVSDIFVVFVLSGAFPDFNSLFKVEYESVKALYQQFKKDGKILDSYKLALIGLLFLNERELALASEIVGVLAARQDKATGEILQSLTSITRSTGTSLSIETTSLTMLLILRLKDTTHDLVLQKAMKFILSNLKGGYFVSTQATILSLLAISEFLSIHSQSATSTISFDVQLNSLPARILSIKASDAFESKCLDLSSQLAQVENSNTPISVSVKPNPTTQTASDNQYLFAISLETYSYRPNSTPNSPIEAIITVSRSALTNIYSLEVTNLESIEQGMTLWEFNKPSCFDFNINDLETLREKKFIDFYEIRKSNSQVAFYWRGMAASQRKSFKLTLTKRFPLNNCSERAHEIYLYYGKDVSVLYRKVA
jgi:hypothetical protein